MHYSLRDTIFGVAREAGNVAQTRVWGSFAKWRGMPPGGCLTAVNPPFEAERVAEIPPDSFGFHVGVSVHGDGDRTTIPESG